MSRIITSIVSVLVGTLLVPAVVHTTPAHAAPAEPKPGDRITIALTSDRQYNSAATWFDAHNRMQTQTDLPLPRQDQKSRLWTGTMVYTNAIRDPHLDVMFQSTGNYARCEIWVNEHRIVEKTTRGKFATVYCDGSTEPPTHTAPTPRHR